MELVTKPTIRVSAPEHRDRFLEAHDVAEKLKGKTVRGAAITGSAQAARFVIRFGSTAVLARLLTPKDYGLVAMAAVVIAFVDIFKDVGLTTATVQRKDITHRQVSMLFWINLLLGGVIALVLVAIAPGVAAFYHEPRLIAITRVLSVSFVFGGLTLQHQALLRRRMQFGTLALLEIASSIFGVAVGVVMAAFGRGYWSLVGMTVGATAANAAGVWLVVPWKPGLPRRGSGTRPLLKFGSNLLVMDVAGFFARQTDMFLIGRFWGPAPLAFYQKGFNLLMQPLGQINAPLGAVIEPALARVQTDPARLRRYFLSSLEIICGMSLPLVVFVAIFAREMVSLLLGSAWMDCVPIFRFLAPGAAVGVMMTSWGWLLIALGQARKYRQTGLASALVIIVSFIIGLPYGAKGVAAGYSCAILLLVFPTWWYITKDTPVSVADVIRSYVPPIVACIPAAGIGIFVNQVNLTGVSHWLVTLAAAASFGAIYAMVLLVGFKRLGFYRSIIRELRLAVMSGNRPAK